MVRKSQGAACGDAYKWIVLGNTTLGMLAAVVSGKQFFPSLSCADWRSRSAFPASLYLISGLASWHGGGKYIHDEREPSGLIASGQGEAGDRLPRQAE